jgi:polysaccharide export outer membrane protein
MLNAWIEMGTFLEGLMRQAYLHRQGKACARALRGAGFLAVFVMPMLVIAIAVKAQPLDPQLLQQLQQRAQQSGQASPAVPAQNDATQQPSLSLQPAAPQQLLPLPLSRLEQIQSSRAGVQLRQFGYEQLGHGAAVTVPQTGAVQDDYILGPGDEIVVSLRGQENNEVRATVDRNGQVLLPRLNPVSATGRSFGSFRRDVEALVRSSYVATTAFVSVARVRQVSVLVSGEVNAPGQRVVTGLASTLDAILLAGGVKKSGSLRNVRLERAGREYVVDLYAVLTDRGTGTNLRLADGDRIRVPVLGPTVAVAGLVRQPGIFELPAGQRSIPVAALMALAGGEEVRGRNRLSLLQIDPDGRSRLVNLPSQGGSVGDSEILFVQLGADQTASQATLSGGTGLAGAYPVTQATTLSAMLKAPGALGQSPYTLFGIIARRDPRTLMRTLVAFTPLAVLNGREDMVLQADDIVRPLSVDEMRLLVTTMHDFSQSSSAQQEALRNPVSVTNVNGVTRNGSESNNSVAAALVANANNAADNAQAQQNAVQSLGSRELPDSRRVPSPDIWPPAPLTRTQNVQGNGQQQGGGGLQTPTDQALQGQTPPMQPDYQQRFVPQGGYALNREVTRFDQLAQQLNVDQLVLINFLLDHRVMLTGAVRGPGTYLVGPSVPLQDLVTAAGGTVNWVDASGVELITTNVDPASGRSQTSRTRLALNQTLAGYTVKPRDEFRFNQIFTDNDIGSITLQGEVRFAGSYRLTRGERLSDVLARAGGLTNSAYPYGTVFLRKSVAALERDGYLRTAKEVQDQLVSALTRTGNNRLDPSTFTSLQSFVSDLRNQQPLGRVSIVADPSVLASRPDLDPLLEPDDVIYIPQRPSTISVLGQVMQPGSFPYRPGESVADYIGRAGGYGRSADSGQTFVVLPDGTARKVEQSWLRFDAAAALPPGSAIVVPRDLAPFDLRQTVIDVSQILGQLAVTVASIAVISKQ